MVRLNSLHLYLILMLVVCLFALSFWSRTAQATPLITANVSYDTIFVARAHLATQDDIFHSETGPAGQFGSGLPKFAPGSKLLIRKANGDLIPLVDGSNPVPATGYLMEVQSPDVSFDGTKIVFAGATTTDPTSAEYGWRLYEIKTDGTGFRKLPIPDRPPTFTIPHNNPNT